MTFDDQGVAVPERFIIDGIFYSMFFNMLVFYTSYVYLVKYITINKIKCVLYSALTVFAITSLETYADLNQLIYAGYDTSLKVTEVLFFYNFKINLAYFALAIICRIIINWVKQVSLQKQIKSQQIKTELALLKSQVHPHFLFNTLNSLYVSAYEFGDESTADGIGKLSHLLRYMLYETNQAKVPLVNEVEYLQNYIALQEMRFATDTKVTFNVEGDISNFSIAPMLLITLVENAFKHGVSPTKKTSINIHLLMAEGKLEFKVINDHIESRVKPALEENSGGIGLANLKKRLAIIYPEQFAFDTKLEHKKFSARLVLS